MGIALRYKNCFSMRAPGYHIESNTLVASIRLIALVFLFICSAAGAALAQGLVCSETVDKALMNIRQNCADLERDSLCYAHPLVEAGFADDSAKADFTSPSQRASLFGLSSVRSSALDSEQAHWGIALLHLGANLPLTYEGMGILVLLAGAAEVINQSDPASVMQIAEPLSTAALTATTRFKKPGIIPEPLGPVAVDDLLLVDAFDDSGDWLRVVNDGEISWVERQDLARLNAMDALPAIGVGATFPFKSMSISTNPEYPECDQAEPMVAIQTAEDLPTSLTINGVDIHIGSMVTIQQVHRNALSLTVHRGKVTTIFGQTVRQGESVIGILGQTPAGAAQVLDWSGALLASEAEIARGQRAQDALNSLARVNGWAQRKTFKHPPAHVHVVERGDTLYSIARLYETSVAEIILGNLGAEPIKLYTGTKLVIPSPGSGFAGHGAIPLDATRES
ncbi:MAG: LysM peptidoglycan-binding domain-containing protein [Chloroflexi bacterium]|nr:LysM peptidoglycan-binding domain-containing protein [Chloroflexota bacterium]